MKIPLYESRAYICGDVVIHAWKDKRVVLTCSLWYTAKFLCQGKQECKRRNFEKQSVIPNYLKIARGMDTAVHCFLYTCIKRPQKLFFWGADFCFCCSNTKDLSSYVQA